MSRKSLVVFGVFLGVTVAWTQQKPAEPAGGKATPEQLEFFEAKIRPVLTKNCYACHGSGSKNAMGGLFLDTQAGMLRGGSNGPAIVPGKPDESLVIRAIRQEGRKMPPAGKLPASVISDLEKWVAMGAPDPRVGSAAEWKEAKVDIEKGRQYWAFQNPVKPATPKVRNGKWSNQPIDRLLLARLEKNRLTPAPEADKATLLRRVTMDLTGLPPTADAVTAFVKDKRPDAYARVVDALLASTQYGERWGRHWLDVARYAESVGRGRNYVMPYAWRYRDYVIDSFNQDKPYNQFVMEQIAGDLLPSETAQKRDEQLIGTAFLSLGSHDLIEQNPAVFRMDVVDEQVHAVSKAFLGITVGCARCHDHKFDPIPTADYYAMAGIFRSTEMLSGLRRRPRDNVSYFDINLLAKLDLTPAEKTNAWIKDPEKIAEWDKLVKTLDEARQGRSPAILEARRNLKKGQKIAPGQQAMAAQKLRAEVSALLTQMDKFPLPKNLAMGVREGEAADCEIHIKGDVKELGRKVPRGFVQVVSRPEDKGFEIGPKESGRRELAKWLARRENPLTARVMVNRVWLHLFGRGIVPTVDNFGKMGEQPTHQDILDYLAVRFMDQGWSVKKVIREVVMSKAYRMSTAYSDRNAKTDPDNHLLWRQNRSRLEVEAIRDSILMVAGSLKLERPAESPAMGFSRAFDLGRGRGTRPGDYAVKMENRSVYVPVLRNFLPQMYETFDFPEPSEVKGRREVTTVPTQALFLVNSEFVTNQSKSAAMKLLAAGETSGRDRVMRVYREVLSRDASAAEIDRSLAFLDTMRSGDADHHEEQSAWARLYQALFASAEFRYRS